MPPASLSDFPVEVLIRVYKSLNTVKDITALNLASSRLHNVWLSNAGSVSDVKLSYITEDYDCTYEHVKIQQKFLDDHSPYQQMLDRNKLILSNTDLYRYFHGVLTNSCSSEPWFNSDETLWSKIFYCLCILDFAEEDTFAQSPRLGSLNLKTLEAMFSLFTSYVAKIIPCLALVASGGGPLRCGLEAMGHRRVGSSILDFRYMLAKRIMALKGGDEVGNSVKNAENVDGCGVSVVNEPESG